ncbi:hypothetical protein V5F59_01635 [Xanthobacter autotrophicus DSM 431]|uniref:hypothetical protein n=1 Tax=Xanthobacter nonsaccharivorans TaxID=3119912 RepID=UPI00372C65DA
MARVESVKADALFAEARTPASKLALSQISDADLQYLALTYLHRLEAGAEPMPLDASLRGDLASEASEKIMHVGQSAEDASLQLVATELAEEARVDLGRDATIVPRLAEYVQRALIEHYSREIYRADLAQERSYDPLFANVDRMSPPPPSRLTLARAVELYKAEPDRAFAAPAFSSARGKGWMYWLPRIALFTGARFAELLGLKAADVVEIDGVHMLRIEPNDGRLEVRFTAGGLLEMVHHLFTWGTAVEILAPQHCGE